VRRLVLLPLLALLAFVPSASATDEVPCHGVYSGDSVVGVCAGVVCGPDLCGPRVVVGGDCEGVGGNLAALCAVWDDFQVG